MEGSTNSCHMATSTGKPGNNGKTDYPKPFSRKTGSDRDDFKIKQFFCQYRHFNYQLNASIFFVTVFYNKPQRDKNIYFLMTT